MEHVILVAVVVDHDGGREEAERWLHGQLNLPEFRRIHVENETPYVDSWWIAEDDRHDGSDCDSAVFVPMGEQQAGANLVVGMGGTNR